MDISSYVLLSHEQALRRRLDVAANNMANLGTTGFKREQPVFREWVERSAGASVEPARRTSFVLDMGAAHDTSAGSFEATGNPLDVAIDGPGYLSVETPDGGAFTRAGRLQVSDAGELVTAGGQRVLGEGGKPIAVPADQAGTLSIGRDGTVTGAAGAIGRIAVTVFDDERAVEPRGDGLLSGQGGRELAAADTRLRSGGTEASNVQPVVETTAMVEILRSYQTSAQLANGLAELRKTAIDRLGRFG